MITVSFKFGSEKKIQEALKTKGPKLVAALTNALNELMGELQARIQAKLSGEVLNVRTGNLLRSVALQPAEVVGSRIIGRVTAGGDIAFYGKFHEYGVPRSWEILPRNKRALAFFPQGALGSGPLAAQGRALYFKQGFRRGQLKTGTLGEFTELGGVVVKRVVHPPLPIRSFMRSSVDELRARIIARLHESAAEAIS